MAITYKTQSTQCTLAHELIADQLCDSLYFLDQKVRQCFYSLFNANPIQNEIFFNCLTNCLTSLKERVQNPSLKEGNWNLLSPPVGDLDSVSVAMQKTLHTPSLKVIQFRDFLRTLDPTQKEIQKLNIHLLDSIKEAKVFINLCQRIVRFIQDDFVFFSYASNPQIVTLALRWYNGYEWRNVEYLASGSFAKTYKLEGPDGNTYVLKIPLSEPEKKREFQEEKQVLKREASLLKSLSHRNILPYIAYINLSLLDPNQDPQIPCLITPFMSNSTLLDYRRNHCVPWDLLDAWIRQIALGLHNMHNSTVLDGYRRFHGDFSTKNVFLNNKLQAIIGDFGGSQLVGSTSLACTIPFSPPERFDKDQKKTEKVDSWSLGVILYFIICERFPFGSNYSLTKKGLLPSHIEELKQKNTPEHIIDIISGLLIVEVDDRFSMEKVLSFYNPEPQKG